MNIEIEIQEYKITTSVLARKSDSGYTLYNRFTNELVGTVKRLGDARSMALAYEASKWK